eukprot:3245816-Pleurochrysis_carterae.AAC.1
MDVYMRCACACVYGTHECADAAQRTSVCGCVAHEHAYERCLGVRMRRACESMCDVHERACAARMNVQTRRARCVAHGQPEFAKNR